MCNKYGVHIPTGTWVSKNHNKLKKQTNRQWYLFCFISPVSIFVTGGGIAT